MRAHDRRFRSRTISSKTDRGAARLGPLLLHLPPLFKTNLRASERKEQLLASASDWLSCLGRPSRSPSPSFMCIQLLGLKGSLSTGRGEMRSASTWQLARPAKKMPVKLSRLAHVFPRRPGRAANRQVLKTPRSSRLCRVLRTRVRPRVRELSPPVPLSTVLSSSRARRLSARSIVK